MNISFFHIFLLLNKIKNSAFYHGIVLLVLVTAIVDQIDKRLFVCIPVLSVIQHFLQFLKSKIVCFELIKNPQYFEVSFHLR